MNPDKLNRVFARIMEAVEKEKANILLGAITENIEEGKPVTRIVITIEGEENEKLCEKIL